MIRITIDAAIKIHDPPEAIIKGLVKKLSLPNKAYWQAIKRNPHARLFLSEYVPYYHLPKDHSFITIGRGCEAMLRKTLEANNIEYEIEDRTSYPRLEEPLQSTIELRPYQVGIPEFCRTANTGIFNLYTAFGKTMTGYKGGDFVMHKNVAVYLGNYGESSVKDYPGEEYPTVGTATMTPTISR